jgi:hypothetical protein
MERWFGREESDLRLYWRKPNQSEEDRKVEEIIKKLRGLSVYDSVYAAIYAQCKLRFPKVTQGLVKPAMFQSAASAPTHRALAPNLGSSAVAAPIFEQTPSPRSSALGHSAPSPDTTTGVA